MPPSLTFEMVMEHVAGELRMTLSRPSGRSDADAWRATPRS
jgi:hypothetical protein